MSKRIDLTGQKFGKLLVVNFVSVNEQGTALWNCVCDCGKQKLMLSSNLLKGKTKSCGCMIGKTVTYTNREFALKKRLYSVFCRNSKQAKHEVKIDFEQYINLVLQPCFYCGTYGSNKLELPYISFGLKYNGLDRIDSNIDYIKSNVVTCCRSCNRAKSDMTTQEFQDWLQRVHLHYIQPNEQMDYNI